MDTIWLVWITRRILPRSAAEAVGEAWIFLFAWARLGGFDLSAELKWPRSDRIICLSPLLLVT